MLSGIKKQETKPMSDRVGITKGHSFSSPDHLWFAAVNGEDWRGKKFIRFVNCSMDGRKLNERKKYRIPRRRKTLFVSPGEVYRLFFVQNNWELPGHIEDMGQVLEFADC